MGIKIYRKTPREKSGRKERLSEVILFFAAVSFLGAVWWNALLPVFSPGADGRWLYGSLVIVTFGLTLLICRAGGWTVIPVFLASGMFLWRNRESVEALFFQGGSLDTGLPGVAAAVLTIPVLALWIFVIRSGKGKVVAGAAAAAPFIAAACAGYFPSFRDSWLLLFGGVMYYVAGAQGKMPFLKKMTALLTAAGSFALLAGISVFAGRYLDVGREVEGGFYQTTRETLRTDLVGGIEGLIQSETGTDGSPERTDEMEEETAQEQQEEAVMAAEEEMEGTEAPGDALAGTGGSMDRLKEISSFEPDPLAQSSVIAVQERPRDTVYVAQRTGIAYTGGAWEEGEVREAFLPEEYLAYPEGLDQLEELCRDWEISSETSVGRQIDEAFAALAVYDTEPGPTPPSEDFAEYFLFENHRGFCVHFATAAALLYRMCGYPSVYVEGYAVPASAFYQAEDGSWQARVDGSMGHAWCQVYEEDEGIWVNREHTPAALGSGAEEMSEAETRTEADYAANIIRGLGIAAATVILFLLLAGAFLLQAAFRRRKRRAGMAYTAEGNGIPAMYDVILRTAKAAGGPGRDSGDRHGADLSDELGIEWLESLKEGSPQAGGEEWDWLHEQVMRALFYHPDMGREEWKRAYRLCRGFSDTVRARMGAGKRLLFRYLYCLDVFPHEDKRRKTVKKENVK